MKSIHQRVIVPLSAPLAMIAFAANSILCRMALEAGHIDAASFTAVRIFSGALMLYGLLYFRARWKEGGSLKGCFGGALSPKGWYSAVSLFVYAAAFSFAYVMLDAGMGALILFAAVQITMIGAGIRQGERLTLSDWLGVALAVCGLVYLLLPGTHAPPLGASALMALAGVAWGLYSLKGRGAVNPTINTAQNFLRALPLAIGLIIVYLPDMEMNMRGFILAALSGALASGLGYVIWYAALTNLRAVQASVLQLTVPPLAALGGIVFLGEAVTLRLLLASILILGGVAITIFRAGK